MMKCVKGRDGVTVCEVRSGCSAWGVKATSNTRVRKKCYLSDFNCAMVADVRCAGSGVLETAYVWFPHVLIKNVEEKKKIWNAIE